jgi:hypothetical protein
MALALFGLVGAFPTRRRTSGMYVGQRRRGPMPTLFHISQQPQETRRIAQILDNNISTGRAKGLRVRRACRDRD